MLIAASSEAAIISVFVVGKGPVAARRGCDHLGWGWSGKLLCEPRELQWGDMRRTTAGESERFE